MRRRAEIHPYSFESHNELGYFYFKTRKFDAAIESFQKALALHPDAGMTRFNLAAAYLDSGRAAPAARELRRCLTMPHADLLFDLVKVNLKIALLLDEIDDRPNDPRNHLKLLKVAGLYYSQKEYGLALKHIERAISLNPEFADAYLFRGMCYEAKGMREEARESYRKTLDLDPRNQPARQRLSEL